jgi:hypothetical protein
MTVQFRKEVPMCYEFELEYHWRRAEAARRELEKAQARTKQQAKPEVPAKPAEVDQEQAAPVPV